jgi:EmrB/QacA subfamily drug resistance transporter
MDRRRWLILLGVGAGTFMTALDSSIVNTTLPLIRQAFGADIAAIEWVTSLYVLALSGLMLGFGRLGDLRGHKRTFVWGFGLFVGASMLCGLAPNTPALVAARVLQAVGGAAIVANGPALLTRHFPPAMRGQVLGLQATMTYLGMTTGPTLGGLLATHLGWRAIFYVNVPIGAAALAASRRFIPNDAPQSVHLPFDVSGAMLFLSGMMLLLLGLDQGSAWGWRSTPIVACLVLAVVLGGLFLRLETRLDHPMLDLSLFRSWTFSAAVASAICNYVCVYSIIFLVPFYLEDGRHFGAQFTGLLLTAQPLVMAVTSPLAGMLSDRIGVRMLSTVGMAILAAALYGLSRLGADATPLHVVGVLALAGLGTGIFTTPNNSALMGAAPRQRQGIAAGVLATARNGGMALGVGLAGAVMSTVAARAAAGGQAGLLPGIGAAFAAAAGVGVLGAVLSVVRG